MSGHPYQPGTVWAPKRGSAKPRTVIAEPADPGYGPRSYAVQFSPVVWYEGSDYPCTVKAFKRWAGEKIMTIDDAIGRANEALAAITEHSRQSDLRNFHLEKALESARIVVADVASGKKCRDQMEQAESVLREIDGMLEK